MKLQDKNLKLGYVDLGAVDAESDKRLGEYFVTTPQAKAALELRKSHFLGRKGAGKSALFTQLGSLFIKAGHTKLRVIPITPNEYAWSALRQYKEAGLLSEQAHANAWKFTIAVEIAAVLTEESDALYHESTHSNLKRLRKFIQENYGGKLPDAVTTAKRLVKGLDSFDLGAFGFKVGFKRGEGDQPLTPQIVDLLFNDLQKLADDIGIVVAFDRLDDSWDGSDEAKSLLIGLLKATKEINDKYSDPKNVNGISCAVFLRSDIYDSLQFDDKDKHRPLEESITWTVDLLRKMVNERLPKDVSVDELFEAGEMRGSIAPFNYIVKRTFLRPREVIQFLQECINRAGRESTEITKDAIRYAEDKYSVWKVEDVKQEYRRLHPMFEDLIEALRQGFHRYDSVHEFENHLKERVPKVIGKLGTRRAMELLFDASVIGVRLGNAGSARFKCEDSDLVLPTSGGVYIHQSLIKGLNLREKRGGVEAPATSESEEDSWF
jgi:hypothetical protein